MFSSLILLAALHAAAPVTAQTKLLRFPGLHGNRVVFTYGGDLWTVPDTGGTATRLTAHPGLELFGRFSPDGQNIAFTGQYDGDEQVYVVPATGGVPKQLTYYPARGPLAERWGYDHQVYGWTPDGARVLFRDWRDSWSNPQAKLFTVAARGGPAEALPMPEAGSGTFSADGRRIVYSPGFRDFRSEKRYAGGQVNRLWIFDLQQKTAEKIPEFKHAQRDEMWIGNTIYFNSDEDGTFNLYAYDPATKRTRQVTAGRSWDVRWPTADPATGRIVYELGGELQILDTKSGQSRALRINVPTDAVAARASRVAVGTLIENFDLSPRGERALFSGRGDVFTAPIERGPVRNLTTSSGAHDREAEWSPDGSRIVYISDRSGEEELWLAAQDGSGRPEQLTRGGTARRFAPRWSPDGSRIAFADKDGKLHVLTVADRRVVEVADDPIGTIFDHTWSPRGNLLAYSINDERGISSLCIWSAAENRSRKITSGFFGEREPVWDPDGNFLYYLSDREYQPQISTREWSYATNRMTRVYAMALRRDVKNPFPALSDEAKVTDTTSAKPATPAAAAPAAGPITIDYEGIETRVALVPIDADNLFGLTATKGQLLYIVSGAPYYARPSERRPALRVYTLADRRESTISDNASGYALSADGLKVLVNENNTYALYDAKPNAAASKKVVATTGLFVERNPAEEWPQIFDEVWRRYRDYFYVANMHGNDWDALRAQYRPLLQYVAHRSDLNYVIAEMLGELTVQHAYIAGGDWQMPARPQVALPGARFALDPASGKYRITRIFSGQNEEPNFRSPLTEMGVDVKVGDYIHAVDGVALTATEDPYRLFRNKADRPVQLTVSSAPTGSTRDVTYQPVTSEQDLVYLDWVLANRKRVAELSGGTVGYIHVPDMGAPGLREFIKWFYPQLEKGGMVVDVRANGGGNISSMIIDRLRRTPLAAGYSRTSDVGTQYPRTPAFRGALVSILNENSASDGDIFPAMFKAAGLGPLIGKRSWGGVVGITDRGMLIDGGVVNVPEFGFSSLKGEWIIEGYGVDPDIEVEQDPVAVIAGRDPQLERAVKEVMDIMKKRPMVIPPRPIAPVKVKKGN